MPRQYTAYTPPEDGLCLCGCGQTTPIATATRHSQGVIKGKHLPFCFGHKFPRKPAYIVDPETGCWVWQRGTVRGGYGSLKRNYKPQRAHRWYYEQANGPIPAGMDLDHLCRNRLCVNPDHMEPVTRAVNLQRGSQTKLTAEQVREIRDKYAHLPRTQVAKMYGVSPNAICHIVSRRTWRSIA